MEINKANDPLQGIVVPPKPQETKHPDLSFPQPTELIPLPTKGKYYPAEHPCHNVDSVEIRYMTAKDEEILNSKTLLKKGVALDKMLQGLILDKRIKLDDLFVGDKNSIVIAARITGYGSEYKPSVICYSCGEKSFFSFNLNGVKPKELTPEQEQRISCDGSFEVKPPKADWTVRLRFLKSGDEKAIALESEKRRQRNFPEQRLTDQLRRMIVSVNNDDDSGYIDQFMNSLLAMHAKYLRDEYQRLVPNINLEADFECPKCDQTSPINIPFTAEFFWPSSG